MADPASDLHVLSSITIESPCCVPWEQIEGTDHVPFCQVCEKHVFDVIEMTTMEAAALLSDANVLPCVRICRTSDGHVVTADHVPGVRGKIWRKLRRKGSWAAGLFAILFLPGCQSLYNSFFTYGSSYRLRDLKEPISSEQKDTTPRYPKPDSTDTEASVPKVQ